MKSLFASLAALLTLATLASANPYADKAQFRLLEGWTEPDGTRIAALEVTLAQGWHTYWRAPGDAGVPLHIDWSGSRNLADVSLRWPSPVVFDQDGLRTLGYKKKLVLPFVLTPKKANKPVALKGRFDLGVCKDICVPVQVKLEQVIAASGAHNQATIGAALAAQPLKAAQAGVSALSCRMRPENDGVMLEVSLDVARLGSSEHAAVETGDPLVWATTPQVSRSGQTLTLRSKLVHAVSDSFAVNRSALRFTLLGSRRAVDIQGCG